MDGIIITAFILGIPANEIVLPIIIMAYSGAGSIGAGLGDGTLRALFTANGWDCCTALCVAVFCICHFPCATTLMTVRKESGSRLWTAVAFILPTAVGLILCLGIRLICGI